MTFRFPPILILAAAVVAIVFPIRLLAEGNPYEKRNPPPWLGEVKCKDDTERQRPGLVGAYQYRLCFEVAEEKLYPRKGDENQLDFIITVYGPAEAVNLGLSRVAEERPDSNFAIESDSSEPQLERHGLAIARTYRYRLNLRDGLRPRPLRLKVNGVIGKESFSETYDLPLGAQGEGWVDIVNEPPKPVVCWSRWNVSNCEEITLTLTNKLDYRLEIESIDLSSDSPSLVADQQLTKSMTLPDNPSPQRLTLMPKSQGLSWESVFGGFGKTPKLFLTITFKDRYQRKPFSKAVLALEPKPNYAVLAIFLLLGAAVGTVVRIKLGRLQKSGAITRKQKFVFAGTTFATGVLVCLIALFAEVKLVVFKGDYSTYDPKILFLTALVATVSGFSILYALLKLPAGSEPDSKKEEEPTGKSPNSPA